MFPKRAGLIIWLKDARMAKNLYRHGHVQYVSKRYNYVMIYTNASEIEEKISYIEKLNYVKKVERSYRHEIEENFTKKTIS